MLNAHLMVINYKVAFSALILTRLLTWFLKFPPVLESDKASHLTHTPLPGSDGVMLLLNDFHRMGCA